MSERIKYTIKQLKQPDKFRQLAMDVIEKIPENFNKIVYGCVILVLALVAIYIVNINKQSQRMEANKIFQQGLAEYDSGQIEQALGTFRELREQYPGQKTAKLGVYYSGMINYEIGNYEESIQMLSGYLDKGTDDPLLRNSSVFTIGLAHFNMENWDEAIDTLSRLEGLETPYKRKALLHIGMAYEKKEQFDKSEQYFKRVLEENARGSQFSQPGVIQQ